MESAQSADQEQTISDLKNELDVVVFNLLNNSHVLKEVEEEKNNLRSDFFRLASEYIKATQTLAHQYIEGSFSVAEANKYVENNYPEWRLVKRDDEGILIEEDPDKMKFVWTSEENIQCSRNIAMIGAKFDIDRFMQDKPDIANRVCNAKIVYEFDEKTAQEIIDEDPELLPVFQEYAMQGKVQTKLASPKVVERENNE